MQKSNYIFYFMMIIAMTAWGASWVIAKVLSDYITAEELIFYRYLISTITLVPVLIYLKQSFKINIKTLLLALVASIFLVVYSIFFFNGTKFGTAGLGGAFVTTLTPILTFVLLVSFFKKEFVKKDIYALILGAIGVMTILNIWSFSMKDILVISNLYFIYACIAWSFLTITNSKLKDINPLVFTFYLYVITTIIGYFITPFESGNIFEFDILFWINLIIISVVSTTFATSIYFVAITKIGANEASSFIFLVPFNAIFLSYIFLDEPIYLTTVIGTILTIIAVSILNKVKLPKFFK
ncbi:MAG: DMT family transporter [Campylobacterota bacterium]|nr:DMT family transporter [Campylobacterota bacterium]